MYETNFNKAAFCAFALSSMQVAFAWGLTGHRIIAEIAENHLNGKAEDILSISLEKKDWRTGQTGQISLSPILQAFGNLHLHGIM